jgi:ubiquinone biosynthesis protein
MIRNIIYIIRILNILFTCKFLRNAQNRGKYLAKSMEKLGPSFVKFGQALSVRPDIVGDKIAQALATLQDKMPPFSTKKAIAIIEKEAGLSIQDIFLEFEGKAVAAASIAQVHKAVLKDGQVVAVKVIRPNITKKFKHDLLLFYFVARVIAKLPSCKRLRPVEVIDVFAVTVKKELDLRLEAASCSQLLENCKNDEGIYIPKIFWKYTSKNVLVMEWVDGIQINDKESLLKAGHDLKIISERLAVSFLNQAFRDGFFHADIHPGNLFVGKTGDIVPVDFGIMGRLDKSTRIYIAEILRGFITGDYMHVAQLHFDAGYVPADKSVYDFALACRAIGEPIIGLPANEVSIANLLAMLFKVTEDFEMQTQPQLLLLQKTMVLIEGVGMSLYPEVNMWQMAEGWIESWAKDNLGVEAHIKETMGDLLFILKNLPQRLKELDSIIGKMAKKENL